MKVTGNTSDGYHTFNELYNHRMVLFASLCNQNKENSWKALYHDDGTMFDDYFICGIETSYGQCTYHYKMKYWNLFKVKSLEKAPVWDGHTSNDVIERLLKEFCE
jgi:hypothetical protein